MAKSKPAGKPDPAIVKQLSTRVLAEIEAIPRPTPTGAQAAPGDFGKKLRKVLPHILTALMEVGAVAADGQLSADEVRDLAGKLFEFVRGLRQSTPTPPAA